MILVGDIGGTKTDLALYEMEGEKLILRKFSAYHSKDHAGLSTWYVFFSIRTA